MGVYIKNMEMPSSCDECELCTCYVLEDGTEENYRCVITFYPIHEFDERHEYCPLVSVPPHGRLIDADALEQDTQKRLLICNKNGNQFQKPYEVMRAIALAPTIIEAEEL